MVRHPKPHDPFTARMEAKRQAEWTARLAKETTDKKPTALGSKEQVGWVKVFRRLGWKELARKTLVELPEALWRGGKFVWNALPAFVLSLSSLLGLVFLVYVGWLVVKAVREPTIAIAPIPIPKELAERGYRALPRSILQL